jgi:hypothetical protein
VNTKSRKHAVSAIEAVSHNEIHLVPALACIVAFCADAQDRKGYQIYTEAMVACCVI